ncbi:C1 family peptidase [Methanobrevibacter sp.]|uniref:C1 family peptidase n=1 Tax=Methanobrevibacter sp. TaxID=66852 RepID=UPI00386FAB98
MFERLDRSIIILSFLLLLLVVIPVSFAEDNNTTDISDSSSNDIYFDINAVHDHGDGSADNPYKTLRDARILDNSVIHLANGEYNYSVLNTHSNISFYGSDASKTIINGHGAVLVVNKQLILSNVTICDLTIYNQGNLRASNTIFANSSAISSNDFGGAIYCGSYSNNAYLDGCTFINNYAKYGGAIYLKGGILEINDCSFINNTAYSFGGAIACQQVYNKPKVTIKRSKFISDSSLYGAGGAVYIETGSLNGEDIEVINSSADFGAAFTLLSVDSTLKNIYCYNSTAKYDGGSIYQVYGTLNLSDSSFILNKADNAGALFIYNSTGGSIRGNVFENNSAISYAGAFYSLLNDKISMHDNVYLNNTAGFYSNLYEISNLTFILTRNNYTLYNGISNNINIPVSYMSPRTTVKNQLSSGNCWSFAILATLESAILAVSDDYFDLSEGNMKNLASYYSYYGWSMDTNEGGFDNMGFGYLVSWLGPVLESDDEYDDKSSLSPILESIFHVQNMRFFQRSSNTDLDEIKKAIMDYGAVYSSLFMTASYNYQVGHYVQYYTGSLPNNHAVALVGWDDDFVIPNAPGKGAWIAKNSWGSSWGDNGYFYISYYDSSCLKLGDSDGAIAFVFNDTIKYDKNYQYDVGKTDYLFDTKDTVWYKNMFTSTDNEYLAAVSTYFEKTTEWDLSVYVNGNLKTAKSGKSAPGYYTIDLDDFIPLDAGDAFEVLFKIRVDGDAGVPISEIVLLNSKLYHEGISFISYDGKSWKDLYDYEGTYPDHVYNSQVACIKAFTILNPINTTLSLAIENRTSASADLIATVLNEYGYPVNSGNVVFRIGDETYSVKLNNGVARLKIDLKDTNVSCEFNLTGYVSSNRTVEITSSLISTNISLTVSSVHNPINITAMILDKDNNPVSSGIVNFIIGNRYYPVEVADGLANLNGISVMPGIVNVSAYYSDSLNYDSSSANISFEITYIDTRLELNVSAGECMNPVNVTVYVFDENNNPINSGHVLFLMSEETFRADVVNGTANITHTFTQTGFNNIFAYYHDDSFRYNVSFANTNVTVSKMDADILFSQIINENYAIFGISIKNCAREYTIDLNINGIHKFYNSNNGNVLIELKDLPCDRYDYIIRLSSVIYRADPINGSFNITYHKTSVKANGTTLYYGGPYSAQLFDANGSVIPDRDLFIKINGQTYKGRTDSNGFATFHIKSSPGFFIASVNFIGDDEYIKSTASCAITVKSTIETTQNSVYAFNAQYTATLRDSAGNLLVNREISIVLNNVNYRLVTDKNGAISLKIALDSGKYDLRITNPQTGEVMAQKIKVVNRITKNKNLKIYYASKTQYKVRVCDDYGNYVKGLRVTFKIDNKKYYAYTDENGYAALKIRQKPGTYEITAGYDGFKVSNKIIVKSTIITKNIKVKKGKAIRFTAKLVSSKGKKLKNKKMLFKFHGKKYVVKTNKKGKAVLKVNEKYKKGKYSIISKYGKLKIRNKITIG